MRNHKRKPVYTFDGCLAIMRTMPNFIDRYHFMEKHRDLINDSEKLAEVLATLGSLHDKFLKEQEAYWEEEFASSEEVEEALPSPNKAKPSPATIFGQPAKQSYEYSDDRHHSRRNGRM